MHLGAPLFTKPTTPDAWIAALRAEAYTAAFCPVDETADDATVRAYVDAAAKANIVIAEVGAWSNPIDPDPAVAKEKIDHCIARLALADRVGARCCVNIAGSRNPDQWAGPHPDNFSDDTFDAIVQSLRAIIDAVKPTRTHYALELMPWVFPSSADENLRLIEAVDRKALAVHFDPVNIINSPALAYRTGDVIRECFDKLGSRIVSCHAKDIALSDKLTVHLDEVMPGKGVLDYPAFLHGLSKLDGVPLMLEHLKTDGDYRQAAAHIRSVAKAEGLAFA